MTSLLRISPPGAGPAVLRDSAASSAAARPPGQGEDHRPIVALRAGRAQCGQVIAAFLPWLAAGRPIYCLDGGNIFEPYRLGQLARLRGLDAAPLLERIFVSRAYTCHQLAGAVETLLGPLVEHAPPPPALILGIDKLFLDEDLNLRERRYLYGRILARAGRMRRGGLPLLITFLSEPATPWIRQLAGQARVAGDAAGTLRRIEQRLGRPVEHSPAA